MSSAQIYICLSVKSTNYKTNLSLEVPGNTRGSVLVATLKGVVHRENQLQALDFQIDCFENCGVDGVFHVEDQIILCIINVQ